MYLWINKKGHLLFSDLIIHRRDEKVDEITLQCTNSALAYWNLADVRGTDSGRGRESLRKQLEWFKIIKGIYVLKEIFHAITQSLHVHLQQTSMFSS